MARVIAIAEVTNKVIRLNSAESSLVVRVAELYTKAAASLSSQLDELTITKEKIR